PRRPAPADDRDRRRRRGLLGDRPQPCPLTRVSEPDRRRAGVLPGRVVRAGVAGRGRAGPRGVPDRRRADPPGRDPGREPAVGATGERDETGAARRGRLLWLFAGAAAIAAGTAVGWSSDALAAIVTPPPLVRAALVGAAVAIGVVLLLNAVAGLAG